MGDVTEFAASIWPFLLACLAAVFGIWKSWAIGRRTGITEERAKHAEMRESELDRIRRAAVARPLGELRDDPYNRDRS